MGAQWQSFLRSELALHAAFRPGGRTVQRFVGIRVPGQRQESNHSGRLIRASVLDHVTLEMILLADQADLADVAGHAVSGEHILERLQGYRHFDRPGVRELALDALLAASWQLIITVCASEPGCATRSMKPLPSLQATSE